MRRPLTDLLGMGYSIGGLSVMNVGERSSADSRAGGLNDLPSMSRGETGRVPLG